MPAAEGEPNSGIGAEKGLSRYKSEDIEFQYSRHILNISISSTSDTRSKYCKP